VVIKELGCSRGKKRERHGCEKKSSDVEKCALFGLVEMKKQTFWRTNRLNRTGQGLKKEL